MHYLLSIYQPEGGVPAPETLANIMRELNVVNEAMKAAGVWVFTGGLHPASSATVAQVREGQLLITDGPFAEGKEFVGGLYVISAPDLDAALHWAGRIARVLTPLSIEVRPFQGEIKT